MAFDPHPLRTFLQGIVSGRSSAIPGDLRGLARGVLGGRAGAAEVDDLIGEFLLRLVEATRRNGAGSAAALVALSDSAIRASIRHRFRQVLAENGPGARLRKQLRAMVKVVLTRDMSVPPACLPTSLYRGDRLCAALVRETVAWVLAQDDRPARTAQAIAARLQALYFDRDQPRPVEPTQQSFEEDVVRALDAPQLALDLRHHLGPALCRVAALRAAGADLQAIAEDQQVALSTAHQRVATAAQRIRRVARRRRIGPSTLEPVLVALGQ